MKVGPLTLLDLEIEENRQTVMKLLSDWIIDGFSCELGKLNVAFGMKLLLESSCLNEVALEELLFVTGFNKTAMQPIKLNFTE